ncbi:MAG: type IV pilus twitching motility protein PilT [Firmicutes bacterium]|nr:type IV pilus twitching motility protein PilT [Bacillota bacterium]
MDALLALTKDAGATDLHLCPGSRPMIRVNGRLEEVAELDGAPVGKIAPEEITAAAEVLLDGKKRRRLEEERVLDFSFSMHGLGRFRANIYSQRGTLAMAVRRLPFEVPKFAGLGLPPAVEAFTARTKGLFLATGATGSGKSTTLASMIDLINENYSYHILTIEDPIEYLHRHKKSLVTQREIGDDADSFAQALRSALREDPDVIMVGEMRDPETISIAMTAAETGHLVFSTLHTVGAAKTIDRVVDAFPTAQQSQVRSQLAAVLEGVVSQQLIPRADGAGFALASEVLFVNPAVRNLIREGKHYQINSVIQTGQAQGMQVLEADLARLYLAGVIDMDEVKPRAQDMQVLQQYL